MVRKKKKGPGHRMGGIERLKHHVIDSIKKYRRRPKHKQKHINEDSE